MIPVFFCNEFTEALQKRSSLCGVFKVLAGLPALWCSEPGQVRKEAATAIFCKCRGQGSPPFWNWGAMMKMHVPIFMAPLGEYIFKIG